MGEKTTVELSTTAVRHLGKLLNAAADRHAAALAEFREAFRGPEPAACALMHGTPWHRTTDGGDRHLPSGAEVVAFLDDAGSIRWIGLDYLQTVPPGWHTLLVGPTTKAAPSEGSE